MKNHVIVVDDDQKTLTVLQKIVKSLGYTVEAADSITQARSLYQHRKPDVMIIDVMLPDGNGVDLIEDLDDASVKFIVITGHPTIKVAIQALKTQVFDFIEKPVGLESIKDAILRAMKAQQQDAALSNNSRREPPPLEDLIGSSAAITRLKKEIAIVAETDRNIFISGESGTGKELVARHIHAHSGRQGQFVAVNCGSIADETAIVDFFGQQRVDRVDSEKSHIGYLDLAHEGTLFLDEVTEMPVNAQVHLLRVLESSNFSKPGGTKDIHADFRVIAVTNKDYRQSIIEHELREDLYYRLAEFSIEVPPLKEREHDITLLTDHILKSLNIRYGQSKQISHSAREVLKNHNWPGNVRELLNVIHQSYLLSGSAINSHDININENSDSMKDNDSGNISNLVGKTFWEVEKALIFATLEQNQGDKEKTAEILGISLKTLYNRLHAYS